MFEYYLFVVCIKDFYIWYSYNIMFINLKVKIKKLFNSI